MAIKYRLIADALRKQILSTKSLVPYKLPTEKELCLKYQVSRQTVRQALCILAKENLIVSRQGSGIYTVPLTKHLNEKKIVLLISEDDEYTYPAFISDIQNNLRSQGISLSVYTTKNDFNIERSILMDLMSQSISILLIEGIQDALPNPNLDLYEKLQFSGAHILFINSSYPQLLHCTHIRTNDYEGGYLLGEHFIAADLKKVACILPDYAANAKERYWGLLSSYRDHSLPIPENDIYWYSRNDILALRTKHNTKFLTDYIQRHYSQEDAIFCYSDEIAYWLIKEFSYAGIKVPEQTSVSGFDNSYLCNLSRPSITSLSTISHELGNTIADTAMEILYNLSENETSTANTVPLNSAIYNKTLPWKLISRSSVLTSSYE